MKMPHDIDAFDQFRALRILGYESLRQDGSHIRLPTTIGRLPTLSTKVLCSIFGTLSRPYRFRPLRERRRRRRLVMARRLNSVVLPGSGMAFQDSVFPLRMKVP